jgi:osmotically-inducible protein OsmY
MDEAPEYVAERLRRRLAEDGRVNVLGIDVSVRGRDVFVSGSVPTEERRRAADDLAHEELPGHVIHNGLTVLDISTERGPEVLP